MSGPARPALAAGAARGDTGAALVDRVVALGWVERRPRRVVAVTDAGWTALADRLDVDLAAWGRHHSPRARLADRDAVGHPPPRTG